MANGGTGQEGGPSDRRPAHEVRLGRVKASVWANETEHGVRHTVKVCRLYKDDSGKWVRSDSFGREDLLLLAKVVDLAHTWVMEQSKGPDVPS